MFAFFLFQFFSPAARNFPEFDRFEVEGFVEAFQVSCLNACEFQTRFCCLCFFVAFLFVLSRVPERL
jgi:hypothetical protein